MKDKVNQMFKDKLFLVMMVIGLLTAVAAVGVLTVSNTDEKGQSPYLEVPGGDYCEVFGCRSGCLESHNLQFLAEIIFSMASLCAGRNTG